MLAERGVEGGSRAEIIVPKTNPTASLMRNDLLNTARRAHKHAQKTPKATQRPRPLGEAVLSDAVGVEPGVKIRSSDGLLLGGLRQGFEHYLVTESL